MECRWYLIRHGRLIINRSKNAWDRDPCVLKFSHDHSRGTCLSNMALRSETRDKGAWRSVVGHKRDRLRKEIFPLTSSFYFFLPRLVAPTNQAFSPWQNCLVAEKQLRPSCSGCLAQRRRTHPPPSVAWLHTSVIREAQTFRLSKPCPSPPSQQQGKSRAVGPKIRKGVSAEQGIEPLLMRTAFKAKSWIHLPLWNHSSVVGITWPTVNFICPRTLEKAFIHVNRNKSVRYRNCPQEWSMSSRPKSWIHLPLWNHSSVVGGQTGSPTEPAVWRSYDLTHGDVGVRWSLLPCCRSRKPWPLLRNDEYAYRIPHPVRNLSTPR